MHDENAIDCIDSYLWMKLKEINFKIKYEIIYWKVKAIAIE